MTVSSVQWLRVELEAEFFVEMRTDNRLAQRSGFLEKNVCNHVGHTFILSNSNAGSLNN